MAVQFAGKTAANLVEVDPTQSAARVTTRPQEVLSWVSLSVQSGALTGLAAAAPVFSFRNSGSNNILVRRVGAGFVTSTAFTTSQLVDFGMTIARSFTASDTGGTPVAASGSTANGKHRTSLANPTSLAVAVATTGALTAGTRTLDANFVGQIMLFSAGLGSGTASLIPGNMLSHDTGDYPLVLAPNEGFVIAAITAFGGGGAGKLYVQAEFAEVATAAF